MDKECCYSCQYSELFDKPELYTDGVTDGELYGYCHKGGGKYNIFVPGGKCKDYKSKDGINTEEYLDMRCCMCPNTNKPSMICPGIKGTPHPNPSQCRFVKMYTDKRGWKYKVMSGIGNDAFKGRYQDDRHTGDEGWHGIKKLEWRDSFDKAQSDLNILAEKNGWKEWITDQVSEEGTKVSEELQEVKVSYPEWYHDLQYDDAKGFIRDNIKSTARSFVAIGYYLKYIRDHQMYIQDGYENIWDLAQAEFGISKSQASKFMSINDRFSKDGNSPILLEQYRDFSSSKLSEMLYLTDEQLEQVTPVTTVAEIREIRKPEEVVSTSKQEPEQKKSYLECASYDFNKFGKGCTGCFYDKPENNCPYDRTEYFEKAKQQEEFRIRCDVLKEMCDSLCKNRLSVLEKSNYSMDAIKNVSRGTLDFSFGFGDDGARHSKYDAEYKAKTEQYRVKEFNGSGKWIFEAGEVDQQIWNVNGNGWRRNQLSANDIPEPVNEQPETVDKEPEIENDVDETVIKISESVIKEPEDVIASNVFDCPCDTCGYEVKGCCDYDTKDDYCVLGNKWVPKQDTVETVEADIVQTEPEKKEPLFSEKHHMKELIKREEETLAGMRESWAKNNPDALRKHELMLLAYKSLLNDLEYPVPEPVKPVQPELPVLKNNDQRKEWAENYKAWGEWYYDEHIDVHYYKYDFSNGDRLIVAEYLDRECYWSANKRDEVHYHLLQKKKPGYGTTKYFEQKYMQQTTSMTEIVDYLKDLQKKGAS